MSERRLDFARLDQERLSRLRALEEALGKVIVAYQPRIELASLTEAQLERIRAAEKELGVVLVAYEK